MKSHWTIWTNWVLAAIIGLDLMAFDVRAQELPGSEPKKGTARSTFTPPTATASKPSDMNPREKSLLERIEQLERRLAAVEAHLTNTTSQEHNKTNATAPETTAQAIEIISAKQVPCEANESGQPSTQDRASMDFFREMTINFTIDGYYSHNFNRPPGRINLLRAYDVMSNSFSLNQAAIIIERAPDVEAGRRFGLRLDLQYGQATETVQGNANNELRPQTYRTVWQAYGTYVAPLGKGLTVDFGKFASSLGFESNYTKDNINYSRSYYFNFLPFYHFGFRAKYPVSNRVTLTYHLMNGVQQSEDFNRFKSQQVALILTPTKHISWQINYYVGREQRDVVASLNPTFSTPSTQTASPTQIIRPAPKGRFHTLDTYAAWSVTDKLTLVGEVDYVINRVEEVSPPSRVMGGVGYARYEFTKKVALAGRAEYLSDRGGLFSGVTQALKETTLTGDFRLASGFLLRGEWRRDFSNQPFFLTGASGILKEEQNTATIGLIWWLGRKEGSW